MEIGIRIKDLRKKKGWSQDELCNFAGLKREYLSRVENGHTTPALHTLQRIADALQVSLSHLVDMPSSGGYKNIEDALSPPGEISQPQTSYQALPQQTIQTIENLIDETCHKLKQRINEVIKKADN